LLFQAFWQGRYVNCTSCGARLQRKILPMVLSALSGFASFVVAMWLLSMVSVPMEIEITLGVAALAAGYLAVHAATLKLTPREDDVSLKL
jgi:hypothetical protein